MLEVEPSGQLECMSTRSGRNDSEAVVSEAFAC